MSSSAELTFAMIPKLESCAQTRFALSIQTLGCLLALQLASDDPQPVTLELTHDLATYYHSGNAENLLKIGPDHRKYKLAVWDLNSRLSRLCVHIIHKKVGE
jgi:hypothetical protein